MLKAFLGYVGSLIGFNSQSVKRAVKAKLDEAIRKAEARVKEDVQFAKDEFASCVSNAAEKYREEKRGAVDRQANALLNKLV